MDDGLSQTSGSCWGMIGKYPLRTAAGGMMCDFASPELWAASYRRDKKDVQGKRSHMYRHWTHQNMNRWSTLNLLQPTIHCNKRTIENHSKILGFPPNGSPAPKLRTPKRSAGRGVVGTGYMLYGHYRNTSLYRMFDCIKCICRITCMIHKLQKHNNYISVYISCMSITVLMYTSSIIS